MFKPIKSKDIVDGVIEQIQELIMEGNLKEGDKLPPERVLIKFFEISRPALREALMSLEMLGLVKSMHGKGNYIINHVNQSYFKPVSLSFKLSNGTPEHLFDFRFSLETLSVKKASEYSTPEGIKKLRDIIEMMKKTSVIKELQMLDRSFHFEIAKISKNPLIINTLESCSYLLDTFIEKTVNLSFFEGDSVENIFIEHKKIVDAIEMHDEIEAISAIQAHLSNIKIQLIKG